MSLKKNLGRSTIWMSISASGTSIVSFFIFIIISRLLDPEQIGLVAFALIFIEFGKLVAHAGMSRAIVQYPVWDDAFAATAFYLNIGVGLALCLLFVLVGGPLTSAYYDPLAADVLQVLTAIFLMEAIKTVSEGKLQREFSFKAIAIRTVVGSLVSGVVGVWLAYNDFGVWALVWQQLINQFLQMIITVHYAHWLPKLTFSREYSRHLIRFSAPILGAQCLGNLSSKIYEFFVGVFLGPAALGFMKVAGRAVYILQDIVLQPFDKTLLSALSRLESPAAQASATLRVIRISAFLTFPAFFGLAAVAPDFILLAFGEKWETAGILMTAISLGIPPMVVNTQLRSIMLAGSYVTTLLRIVMVMVVVNAALGYITVSFGLLMAAIGFSLRNYVALALYLVKFRKRYGVSPTTVLKSLIPTTIACTAMTLAAAGAGYLLPESTVLLVKILVMVSVGVMTYLAIMLTVFRRESLNAIEEMRDILPKKLAPVLAVLERLSGQRH